MSTTQTTPRRTEFQDRHRPVGGNGRRPLLDGVPPCRDASGREYDLASLASEFNFMVPESILSNLNAPSRDLAIRTMVGSLAEAGAIPDAEQDSIADAVIQREHLGTTGIGCGIAIPHTKHGAVDRVIATMAFSREGIEFGSSDNKLVHFVFLLVSPPDKPSDHLRALERISRCLLDRQYWVWRSDQRHADNDSDEIISDPEKA